eukprot:c22066_g2_i1 orf=97-888(-)
MFILSTYLIYSQTSMFFLSLLTAFLARKLSLSRLLKMRSRLSPSFFLLALVFYVLFSSCVSFAQEDDTKCLEEMKASIIDPSRYLSNWVFGNDTPGYLCSFYGVKCWQPDQNRVFSISLSNANLSGTFPSGLSDCTSIQELDLSRNNFQGDIPTNTCVLTPTLTSLNLSWNSFSGGISSNLTDCTLLEALGLQHNNLSGIIPWEIGLIANLTAFDVSYNDLAGQIPATMTTRSIINQTGFPESSFVGNSELCGAPLSNTCVGM